MLVSFFTLTSKLTKAMKINQRSATFYLKGSSSTIMYVAILAFFAIFCVILIGIKSRLNHLNRKLTENLRNEFKSDPFLTSFTIIFGNLKKIIDILNEIFSIPFAIFVSTNLLLVSFLFYDYYALYAVTNDRFNQLYYCLFATVLRSYMFAMVLVSVYCCVAVKTEKNKTLHILQNFWFNRTNNRQRIKVWNLINHIEVSGMDLSCGMYLFDWKMLFNVST